MLTQTEKSLFEIAMALSKAVGTNNSAGVPELIEKINAMELTETERNTIMDAVGIEVIIGLDGDSDVYVLLVSGLNCITNKEYRLKMRRINSALKHSDTSQMRDVLDEALSADPLLDGVENDYLYISFLLHICMALKDYEAMDTLRRKLVI